MDITNKEEMTEKLAKLKSENLEVMTYDKFNLLFNNTLPAPTEAELAVINEYLSKFLVETGYCIFTEESPNLRWGLVHGNMQDTNSGLSWRAKHTLTIGGKRLTKTVPLQYSPNQYEMN